MTKVAIIGAGPCGLSMLRAFELAEKVEELLNDGWVLSGGLASSNSKIFQALTKL